MVEHSDAVDVIETAGREGEREDVCLKNRDIAPLGEISRGNFSSDAQINAHHNATGAAGHLGETPHTASDIEDQLAREFLRRKSRAPGEGQPRLATGFTVKLGGGISLPLKTKTAGVERGVDKTDYSVDVREFATAIAAAKSGHRLPQLAATLRATKNREYLLRDLFILRWGHNDLG